MHLDQVAQLNVYLLRFKKLLRKSVVTAMAEKKVPSNLLSTLILTPKLYGLKSQNFHKTKPTRKPGLSAQMKKDRLEFCLYYEDWTLED